MINPFHLLYVNKLALPSLPAPGTFSNWTVLITGASGGLGLAAATHFVRLGASRVVITARTRARGLAARTLIEEKTGRRDVVEVMELDMDSLASTREFAERVQREIAVIDYVLLNAGVLNTRLKRSRDGWEESIQVNVLSSALLGILLLPWMKRVGNGKAHLGVVTSGRHSDVDVAKIFPSKDVLEYFNKEENFPGSDSYPFTKLMQQYVVNELARLAVGVDGRPGVIVNSMCPGTVATDLSRAYQTNPLNVFGIYLVTRIFKTSEAGARTPVLAALTTPEENGKYVTHYMSEEASKTIAEISVFGPAGKKMQAQVWREVIAVLGEKVPEVREIVNLPA